MISKRVLVIVAGLGLPAVLLTACATSYHEMSWWRGGGVDDLQVSDTTYRITSRGNGYTSAERVHDFILLRASEIAISRGYREFIVSGMTDQTKVQTSITPGRVDATSFPGPVINGVAMPGQTFVSSTPPSIEQTVKPGYIAFVTLVQYGGMDARMINASLARKYGITPTVAPGELTAAAPPLTAAPGPAPQMPVTQDCDGLSAVSDEGFHYSRNCD